MTRAADLLARVDATLARTGRLLDLPTGVDLPAPRVLTERWRPLTFARDGVVALGAPRVGPTPSDVLFAPISVRLTDDQVDHLLKALWG